MHFYGFWNHQLKVRSWSLAAELRFESSIFRNGMGIMNNQKISRTFYFWARSPSDREFICLSCYHWVMRGSQSISWLLCFLWMNLFVCLMLIYRPDLQQADIQIKHFPTALTGDPAPIFSGLTEICSDEWWPFDEFWIFWLTFGHDKVSRIANECPCLNACSSYTPTHKYLNCTKFST